MTFHISPFDILTTPIARALVRKNNFPLNSFNAFATRLLTFPNNTLRRWPINWIRIPYWLFLFFSISSFSHVVLLSILGRMPRINLLHIRHTPKLKCASLCDNNFRDFLHIIYLPCSNFLCY